MEKHTDDDGTARKLAELQEAAMRIEAWREERNMSQARLVRAYPMLGSERTYRDIRDGRMDGYDLDEQHAGWLAALSLVEGESGTARGDETYTDLSPVTQLRRAVLGAMRATGNDRVVVVLGPSGCGKSTALAALRAMYPQRVVGVEATELWSDSPGAFLGAVCKAYGAPSVPLSPMDRMALTLDLLASARRCLVIDEAHHCGPRILNTVKTLVNQSDGEFVLLAMTTLWGRLMTASHQEARQLTTNRLRERVSLELTAGDVSRFVGHQFADIGKKVADAAALAMLKTAQAHGNLLFVRQVCAQVAADLKPGAVPEAAEFATAAQIVAARK